MTPTDIKGEFPDTLTPDVIDAPRDEILAVIRAIINDGGQA